MRNYIISFAVIVITGIFSLFAPAIIPAANSQAIPTPTIFGVPPQEVLKAVAPSFGALGPCPSCETPSIAKVSGTQPSKAAQPSSGASISSSPSAPCSNENNNGSNNKQKKNKDSKHKKKQSGKKGQINKGADSIIELFIKLLTLILQVISGGSINLSADTIELAGSDKNKSKSSQPCSPSGQPNTAPSSAQPSGGANPSGGVSPSGGVAPSGSVQPSGATVSGAPGAPAPGDLGLSDLNKCTKKADGAGPRSPLPQPKCTIQAADANGASAAKSGDVVCFTGNISGRLKADKAGVTYFGGGKTVGGIDISGEGVTVQGFIVQKAAAPGIKITGKNNTLADTTIEGPTTGGDGDGIRFFGSDLKIVHNTIKNISGSGHTDCMQSYATGGEAITSTNVLIDSNRCENIQNIGVIMEGPNSGEGDGSCQGKSENIVIINNYFDTKASNNVFLDDVHNTKIINNEVLGKTSGNWGFEPSKMGAEIKCNSSDAEVIDKPRGGAKCSGAKASAIRL